VSTTVKIMHDDDLNLCKMGGNHSIKPNEHLFRILVLFVHFTLC